VKKEVDHLFDAPPSPEVFEFFRETASPPKKASLD